MKPKLLVVSDTYTPQVDGTVRFIEEFMSRASDTFSLSLLVPRFGRHSRRFPYKTFFLEVSKIFKPLPAYPSIAISLANIRAIKSAVQEQDLIFVQGPALTSIIATLYASYYHKKVVTYLHVIPWEVFEKSSHLPLRHLGAYVLRKLCVFAYNHSNVLLVPYPQLQKELVKKGLTSKLKVARLGVDITRFSPIQNKSFLREKLKLPLDSFIVGYIGRVSPEKNVHTLLQAFRKLKDQRHVHLLIVGDGPAQDVKLFQSLPNCTITGFVNNVHDYCKVMDLFVMPSLTETTSLATLEAMSSGLPVVVSKVGYPEQYVRKNYNGVFFSPRSATLLTEKIEKLRSDPAMRIKLGQNARKTIVYSFSWERSINRIKKQLFDVFETSEK